MHNPPKVEKLRNTFFYRSKQNLLHVEKVMEIITLSDECDLKDHSMYVIIAMIQS